MRYKAPNSPPNSQTALSLCCHSLDAPDAPTGHYSADLAYTPPTWAELRALPAPTLTRTLTPDNADYR